MAKRNWKKIDDWSDELDISNSVRVVRRIEWIPIRIAEVKESKVYDVQEWHIEKGVGEIGWVALYTFASAQSAIDAANTVARKRNEMPIGVR